MMRSIANRNFAIALIVAVLLMNLPSLNLPQTQVSGKTFQQILKKRPAEPQVFEQKGSYGEVVARLRISPDQEPNRVQFQIEDLQRGGRGSGTVEVQSKSLKIRIEDQATRTRFGFDIRPDQASDSRLHMTLRHNKKKHEITIDGERSRAVSGQIRALTEQGKDEEAARLIPEFRAAFAGTEGYTAFVNEIGSSPALNILSATASLKASLGADQLRQNVPLHLIGFAANMLAPSSMKKTARQIEQGRVSQTQPRVLKTGFNPGALKTSSAPKPARQAICVECDACAPAFFLLLSGCAWMYFDCLTWVWNDPWGDPWMCWVLGAACEASAVYFLVWCANVCDQPLC